jgi:spermidine/putrescine transport system ATP-binding protein
MSHETSALTINRVSKQFSTPEGGVVRALDNVSLEVAEGSFTVLLGPSGCGKTTLLRCIAGLEAADSGEISLRGQRIDDVPVWKRRVNTVFQSYALFPHLTVAQNIAFGLQMDGLSKTQIAPRVEEALAMVRLDGLGGRRPSQLSGGQQQRVALARALAKEPEVLLLDEPLSALDLKLRRGMQSELKRLQRETSLTFVLVTHDQEEAMAMADTVAVFDAGRIAQVGEPRDVYLRPRTRFVADFIGEANVLPAEVMDAGVRVGSIGDVGLDVISGIDGQPPGTRGHVAFRPENINWERTPNGDAHVLDVTFVGGDLHIVAEVGDDTITIRASSHHEEPPRTGDHLDLSFPAGSVRWVED